jgi:hypothetical protein
MALSHFTDKSHRPSEGDLGSALGPSWPLWREIQRLVAAQVPRVAEEWGYTTGWSLRLKQGKRVILYMTPCEGHFLASTALGEKAVAAARERRVPKAFLTLLDDAPRYAEGRGIRLAVRRASDVRLVGHLITLKLGA